MTQVEFKTVVEDLVNPSGDESVSKSDENNTKSRSIKDKSGNIISIGLFSALFITLVTCIIINGSNGTIEDSGDELGAIIGLTVTNMILTTLLVATIGFYGFILTITEATAVVVLFVTLLLLLVDFVAFAMALEDYAFFYIVYVVMKVVLIRQFYTFSRIDVKYYGSSVIDEFLRDKTFIKETSQLYRLWPLILIIIFIQLVLFILGCLAFIGGVKQLFELKLIVFILLVWAIKSLTHCLHFVAARAATLAIDPKAKYNKRNNDSFITSSLITLSELTMQTSEKQDQDGNVTDRSIDAVASVKAGMFFYIFSF